MNGTLYFKGTFLSMIPMAIKHGVIKEPIQFEIRDSHIISHHTANAELQNDLEEFFRFAPDHRHIREVGIGTNEGITELYGYNASFEEKHVGIHFGLGGKEENSFHLDMMMQDSQIHFDDRLIFDGAFHL